jgi:hypothetical protein
MKWKNWIHLVTSSLSSKVDAINILLIEPLLAIWRLSPEIKARYAVTAAAIFLQLSHAEF